MFVYLQNVPLSMLYSPLLNKRFKLVYFDVVFTTWDMLASWLEHSPCKAESIICTREYSFELPSL